MLAEFRIAARAPMEALPGEPVPLPGAPRDPLRLTSHYWRPVLLEPGEVLVRAGQPAHAIYLVVDGELEWVHRGSVLGTLHRGAIVGHQALLQGRRQGFGVRARTRARAMALTGQFLHELRRQRNPVRLHLLGHAVDALCRALLRQADLLAPPRFGRRPRPAERPGLRAPLPDPRSHPPDRALGSLLAPIAGHPGASLDLVLPLAIPARFPAGDLPVVEGRPARGALLVERGRLEVLRNGRRSGAQPWGTLGPGELFGLPWVLLDRWHPATLRCLTEVEGWWIHSRFGARTRPSEAEVFRQLLVDRLGKALAGAASEVARIRRIPLDQPLPRSLYHRAWRRAVVIGVEDAPP